MVLGVRNLIELRVWKDRLNAVGAKYSSFEEPDLDGQMTAIACNEDYFKSLRPV